MLKSGIAPGYFRNCLLKGDIGGDSILHVDSKLVTRKALNKELMRLSAMPLNNEKFEFILNYITNNIAHAIDDVNLTVMLDMIMKLGINSREIIDKLVPICYKIQDYSRGIVALNTMAMIPNCQKSDLIRSYAMKIAYGLPFAGSNITIHDIGRLCNSLDRLGLYCRELGDLIIWLIDDEVKEFRMKLSPLSSILSYLGNMGLGDGTLWNLYSNYSNMKMERNTKTLIRLLKSFHKIDGRNEVLFKNIGDLLCHSLHQLHPLDIADITEIYTFNYKYVDNIHDPLREFSLPRSNKSFRHTELFKHLFEVNERILPLISDTNMLKILNGYNYIFGADDSHKLSPKDLRTLSLLFGKSANIIQRCNFNDLCMLIHSIKQFPFIESTLLKSRITSYLNDINNSQDRKIEEFYMKSHYYRWLISTQYKRHRITQQEADVLLKLSV